MHAASPSRTLSATKVTDTIDETRDYILDFKMEIA